MPIDIDFVFWNGEAMRDDYDKWILSGYVLINQR